MERLIVYTLEPRQCLFVTSLPIHTQGSDERSQIRRVWVYGRLLPGGDLMVSDRQEDVLTAHRTLELTNGMTLTGMRFQE